MTAANQQERLSITEQQKWFLAGFIEGEGSVCISIKEHPTAQFGYYVDPEFFLYQHRAYPQMLDRKSTRLNSSHLVISYAVFCLKKKKSRRQITLSSITLRLSVQTG